jgi:hypothetical protein
MNPGDIAMLMQQKAAGEGGDAGIELRANQMYS